VECWAKWGERSGEKSPSQVGSNPMVIIATFFIWSVGFSLSIFHPYNIFLDFLLLLISALHFLYVASGLTSDSLAAIFIILDVCPSDRKDVWISEVG
jgi:hypothetical protein